MFPIWDFVSQKIKLKYFFKKSLFCKISLVFDEMYLVGAYTYVDILLEF